MNLELLTIGTELLLGAVVDTNGAELGLALAEAGVQVVRRTTVPDQAAAIRDALVTALERTGAVLATGGLGPTSDDVTKKVVAELFGWPLRFDEAIWRSLVDRFARLGRRIVESNRSQAEVPAGAVVLPNQWGTAPGLWLEDPRGLVILLPGVPREMRNLLAHEVIPRLAPRAAGTVVRSRTVRTTGIAESALAERLGPVDDRLAPLTLAFLPGLSGVDLRLTAWSLPPDEAERRLEDGALELERLAGEYAYGRDQSDLAARVLDRLRARGWCLALAESCTGGLVGARLTAISGSSDVLLGGLIAYHNRIKEQDLGVPAALLAEHGAVSEPVVRAMAEGAVRRFGADVALALTGIAGPGGGSPEKPVGLVWFAIESPGGQTARRAIFPGDRAEIRARAAQFALALLNHLPL